MIGSNGMDISVPLWIKCDKNFTFSAFILSLSQDAPPERWSQLDKAKNKKQLTSRLFSPWSGLVSFLVCWSWKHFSFRLQPELELSSKALQCTVFKRGENQLWNTQNKWTWQCFYHLNVGLSSAHWRWKPSKRSLCDLHFWPQRRGRFFEKMCLLHVCVRVQT